ncbi:MAG: hypothetical protein ACK4WC_13075, partial [Rubrimonas sp.]
MTVSPFDSALLGALMGDGQIAALLSDTAAVAAMTRVERALARVQGGLGVIPADAARAIDEGLATVAVAPSSLAAGTAAAGVPVPALLGALRAALPDEA